MNTLLNNQTYLSRYLTLSSQSTLKILTWLLQVHKLVTIEKLAAGFPNENALKIKRPSSSMLTLCYPISRQKRSLDFCVSSDTYSL